MYANLLLISDYENGFTFRRFAISASGKSHMRLSGWILYAIGSMGFCQYEKFKILTILTKKGRKTDVMKTKRHGSGTGGLKKISNFFKRNNFLGLNFYFSR